MTYVPPCPPEPPCQPKPFSCEAVVICDKYHDFLGKTLPHNKYLFNKIVVVTSPEDKQTQRICEHWHVECVKTDALNTRWGKLCKGAGINAGLEKLNLNGWAVHMAGREDTVFSQYWPRRERALIPEIVGYHLESDDASMAANWNGRVTAPFEYRD